MRCILECQEDFTSCGSDRTQAIFPCLSCWFVDQKIAEIRNGCDGSHHICLILQHWVRLFYDCLVFYIRSRNWHTVQSLHHVRLFTTPWIAARQASLSITYSWSLLKLMSIESVMPSSHLILCRPLLLQPSIFPSIRVFSSESVLHIR